MAKMDSLKARWSRQSDRERRGPDSGGRYRRRERLVSDIPPETWREREERKEYERRLVERTRREEKASRWCSNREEEVTDSRDRNREKTNNTRQIETRDNTSRSREPNTLVKEEVELERIRKEKLDLGSCRNLMRDELGLGIVSNKEENLENDCLDSDKDSIKDEKEPVKKKSRELTSEIGGGVERDFEADSNVQETSLHDRGNVDDIKVEGRKDKTKMEEKRKSKKFKKLKYKKHNKDGIPSATVTRDPDSAVEDTVEYKKKKKKKKDSETDGKSLLNRLLEEDMFSKKDIKKILSKKLIPKKDLKKLIKMIAKDRKKKKVTLKISEESSTGGNELVELLCSNKNLSTRNVGEEAYNIEAAITEKTSIGNQQNKNDNRESSINREIAKDSNKFGSKKYTKMKSRSERRYRSQSRSTSRSSDRNKSPSPNTTCKNRWMNQESRRRASSQDWKDSRKQLRKKADNFEYGKEIHNEMLERPLSGDCSETDLGQRLVVGDVVRRCRKGLEGRLQIRLENTSPSSDGRQEAIVGSGERGVRDRLGPIKVERGENYFGKTGEE